jgi:hypothetical protein
MPRPSPDAKGVLVVRSCVRVRVHARVMVCVRACSVLSLCT